MKAALFYGGKDIRVEEVADPTPGPGEVVVRVKAAGICGSDLHSYRDPSVVWPGQVRPYMTGHELAGEVAAIGPSVEGLSVGQKVGVEPRHLVSCGTCRWCRRGDYQLCPDLGRLKGAQVHSTGFAEYSLESAGKCYPLPDALSLEEAAILDVLAVAVHAIHKVRIQPTDTVVVFGAGAIGLSTAQAAKAAGARRVVVVDTLERPLAVAKTVGADEIVDATKADVAEAVASITGGQGADVIFETVGGKAPTLLQATKAVSRGGVVGVVGTFVGSLSIEPLVCQGKELTVRWIYSYGLWDGVPEFKIALDMLIAGRIKASPLITHRFPLDQIAEGFAAADDKRQSGAVKVVVLP